MANFNLNKVIIGGRLTADPELKTTPSGIPVVSFTVAVNRRFGSSDNREFTADFFNVTAWRQTAEFVSKYFRKASSICIVGSLQTRNWTDQQGNKRYSVEIVADEANFVDAKNEAPEAVRQMGQAQHNEAAPVPHYNDVPAFDPPGDDEELPF